MAEQNPHYISELNTGANLNQIVDGTDHPHTGLIKSLTQMASGCFIVKDSLTGFDITQSAVNPLDSSDPVLTVAVGGYFDNGEFKTVSSAGTFTSAAFTQTADKSYYLVVVDDLGSISLRVPTAANKVADIEQGDAIICMVEIASDTSFGSRKIQYFTTSKVANSLSVGYSTGSPDASKIYNETGKITGSSSQLHIEATGTNTDIKLTPSGTGQIKVGDSDKIQFGDDLDLEIFHDGANNHLYSASRPTYLTGGGNLYLRPKNGEDGIIINTDGAVEVYHDNDKVMETITDGVHIPDKLGIGTSSPDSELHIRGSSNPEVRVQEDSQNGYTTLIGFADNYGALRVVNSTSNESTIVDVEPVSTGTGAQTIRFFRSANTGGTGRFQVLVPGTATEALRLQADTKVLTHYGAATFNENGDSADFRVESNTLTHALFVDGSADKVGIGTSSPDTKLDISGNLRATGRIKNVRILTGNALGPPPVVDENLLTTDDVIVASTPSGTPPNNLTIRPPDGAASTVGTTLRIITTDVSDTLNLDRQGSDDIIVDNSDATLTLPYALSGAKTYDLIQTDSNKWMLLTLN